MHQAMDDLAAPAYPAAPGGRVPELNLAGAGEFNVASGQSIQQVPDPGTPLPLALSLSGSPEMGGIDPQTPIPALNLAGVEGAPAPAEPTQGNPAQIHQPDFGLPNFTQPDLHSYDLTGPGITRMPDPLFTADPMLPDLDEYRHPYGLIIHNQSPGDILQPDPQLADLLHYDVPQGLKAEHNIQAPDPLLPDLQHPQLTQDVHMQQRPADMADDAQQQVHANPSYQGLAETPYRELFMDQRGVNSSRRRHYDPLLRGLDETLY